MTPDDFPNHSSFLTYVKLIELHLYDQEDFEWDPESLEAPKGWSGPDEYGLVYPSVRGWLNRIHSDTMFSLKQDVSDDDGCRCHRCQPTDYTIEQIREISHRDFMYHVLSIWSKDDKTAPKAFDYDYAAMRRHP